VGFNGVAIGRRQRRGGDARDQLRAAYGIFVSASAGALAERARIELRATGERAPKRTAETRDALTAREAHIARLAGQGASNPKSPRSCSSARPQDLGPNGAAWPHDRPRLVRAVMPGEAG
jgi:hypothetical protein